MSASDFVLLFVLLLAIVAIAVAGVCVLLLRLVRGRLDLPREMVHPPGHTLRQPPPTRAVPPAPSGVSAPAARGGPSALQAPCPLPPVPFAAPRAPRVNTYGELED